MTGRQYRGTVITVPYIAYQPHPGHTKKPGTLVPGFLCVTVGNGYDRSAVLPVGNENLPANSYHVTFTPRVSAR